MLLFLFHFQTSERMSFQFDTKDKASTYKDWQMGATSSCINDIANDDFVPILRIEESEPTNGKHFEDVRKLSLIETKRNTLSVPAIRTSLSDNSISNILDLMDTNNETLEQTLLHVPGQTASSTTGEMKSSGSDVSISFFLDRENIGDAFDEVNFANVNTNMSKK